MNRLVSWVTRRSALVLLVLAVLLLGLVTLHRYNYVISVPRAKEVSWSGITNVLSDVRGSNLVNSGANAQWSNQTRVVAVLRNATVGSYTPLVYIFRAETESETVRKSVMSNQCTTLRASFGQAPICVYTAKEDQWISGSILQHGAWEGGNMNMVTNYLKQDASMALLDLGCNIGVFTIMAAKMGRKVVSVDANRKNLRLLSRSLDQGGLKQNVTLVWNAVADVRGGVSLHGYKGNVGGTYVKPVQGEVNEEDDQMAHAVLLDDLAYLFGKEKVFMKMDIETYEWNALKGGKTFFETVNVRFLFMEFVAHRKDAERGANIINFLTGFNFQPYNPSNLNLPLEASKSSSWPGEVLWVRQS